MILCQFEGGCMGCCKHRYKNRNKILEALEKNTFDLKISKTIEQFRDRAPRFQLRFGICMNAVMINEHVFCPLHAECNQGIDYREGYCSLDYFCGTAREFLNWNNQDRQKFLDFIKFKKLNPIEYSIKMYNGILLREFKKTLKKIN
ncbi:MAG: hypothetical protein EAX96_04690 [Candidatus Lokiarchaeota archaeon]|nr:hypothetical protein [Candidatus Lokiarchaeota archaeon]